MDWWTEVRLAMGSFLDQHGLIAAFTFLLIEEAGVPVPVPGDFLMLILGVHARQGRVELWQAIVVMELATILGSTLLYVAARLAGRNLVYRYGRFIRLGPDELSRAEGWLQRNGLVAVVLGRLVPGLRIVTAVACGVFSVPVWMFLPAMSLGALGYIVFYTVLGYAFGPPVLDFLEHLHLPFGLLGSLVPLVIFLIWTFRARQALQPRLGTSHFGPDHVSQLRAGALAGALATIASTLVMNVVINLAGNIAFQAPGTLVERTAARLAFGLAREAQPLAIVIAVPAFLAVGILWGAVYAVWAEPRLKHVPDWLGGVAFSVIPLLGSLLVALPMLGMGLFGVDATGPVAATGETIRHAAYGLLLGLVYPVLRARRTVRVMAHTPAELTPAK